MNTALRLFRCESDGCTATATRGAYCPTHAIACEDCGFFWSAADLRDGVCPDCVKPKDDDDDSYRGCHCGEGCDK